MLWRFGLPVDPPGDEVLAFEGHLRALLEDRDHVRLDVLADQAEHHAQALLLDGKLLQGPFARRKVMPIGPSSPTMRPARGYCRSPWR